MATARQMNETDFKEVFRLSAAELEDVKNTMKHIHEANFSAYNLKKSRQDALNDAVNDGQFPDEIQKRWRDGDASARGAMLWLLSKVGLLNLSMLIIRPANIGQL